MIARRIITMEFDNNSFCKFTTALGRKLSDRRLFFTKLFLTVMKKENNQKDVPLSLSPGGFQDARR